MEIQLGHIGVSLVAEPREAFNPSSNKVGWYFQYGGQVNVSRVHHDRQNVSIDLGETSDSFIRWLKVPDRPG